MTPKAEHGRGRGFALGKKALWRALRKRLLFACLGFCRVRLPHWGGVLVVSRHLFEVLGKKLEASEF